MTDTSLSLLVRIRTEVRRSRSTHRTERALRNQLAQFTSPAERLELSAVLRRHAPDRAAQVRDLLTR
jgi:hypothetical protein